MHRHSALDVFAQAVPTSWPVPLHVRQAAHVSSPSSHLLLAPHRVHEVLPALGCTQPPGQPVQLMTVPPLEYDPALHAIFSVFVVAPDPVSGHLWPVGHAPQSLVAAAVEDHRPLLHTKHTPLPLAAHRPAMHCAQVVWLLSYHFAGHALHVRVEMSSYWPGQHASQLVRAVSVAHPAWHAKHPARPVALANQSLGHASQMFALFVFSNRPGLHSSHSVRAMFVSNPSPHQSQRGWPAALYQSCGHALHTEELVAGVYAPAGQFSHPTLPLLSANVPRKHG